MSLRARLTVMSAVIVGAVLVLSAVICFVVMRGELRGEIDDSLRAQAELVKLAPAGRFANPSRRPPEPPKRNGGAAPFAQFLTSAGKVLKVEADGVDLPVTDRDRAVARGDIGTVLTDRQADGVHVRVITIPVKDQGALQLARSLVSADRALDRLRVLLGILALGGTLLAVVLSRLFSRRVIAPIADLTAATEHIEATGDLGRRVITVRADEVGRLAGRFNGMLDRLQATQAALETSTAAQRQLVADASHELRTPVSSLRTNIEVLLASNDIEPDERRALLADVVGQTEELSSVVTDLIDLARGDGPPATREDVDLAAIVEESVNRARRLAPKVEITSSLEPFVLMGEPERLARAVNNLLENAAKFSPESGVILVTLRDGQLEVRDHGPGMADDELPHIFDRFYRGRSTAAVNGSGLGLAIVKQVAEAHNATVVGRNATDGSGLIIAMAFPGDS